MNRIALCGVIGVFLSIDAAVADKAPPPDPSPAMMRLIGEYGPSSAGLTPDLLEIYESNGMLFADGGGFHQAANGA